MSCTLVLVSVTHTNAWQYATQSYGPAMQGSAYEGGKMIEQETRNSHYTRHFTSMKEEVKEQKEEVKEQKEEVKEQKEEVKEQKEEVKEQKEEVKEQKEEVKEQKEEVKEEGIDIKDKAEFDTPTSSHNMHWRKPRILIHSRIVITQ
ncbi:golgin subfamily A member 6-like protein 26 [Procambarus clarkii]|uniref:golgin subfamily A member 6-like protein 26 n=1 Tax=Procambarus clarkii TaxID=6728 RepID=UPI003743CBB9